MNLNFLAPIVELAAQFNVMPFLVARSLIEGDATLRPNLE